MKWFPAIFASLCGIGVGIIIGVCLASVGNHTQQASAATDTPPAIAAEPIAEVAASPTTREEWPAWTAIKKAYGHGSPFGDFAKRLEATGWWESNRPWSIRCAGGSLYEASDMEMSNPATRKFYGRMSVWGVWNDKTLNPTIEIDLFRVCLLGDDYKDIQGAFAAICTAMQCDLKEIERAKTIANLIPRVSPKDSLEGFGMVCSRFSKQQQATVSANLGKMATLIHDRNWIKMVSENLNRPRINFKLSENRTVSLCCGDYDNPKEATEKWSLSVYSDSKGDPAWVTLSESEVDALTVQ